jgi:hypothetical protein
VTDFVWQSQGGVLIDGTGDLACTVESTIDSTVDVVRSRLKAALNGWKLYAVGANLQAGVGQAIGPELELTLERQVTQSLSDGFLASSSFQVQTLATSGQVLVLVYLSGQLIVQAAVTPAGVTLS